MMMHNDNECFGDRFPSWNEISLNIDKYRLITEKLKCSFGSDDKESNLYIDPNEYNLDEIFHVLFQNLGSIDSFINTCSLDKVKTSKKLDHLCDIIKKAFQVPKVRVHDPRHYVFETAFVILLAMNPIKGGILKYPTLESFLQRYPHFQSLDSKEKSSLKSYANYMNVAFLIMKPEANRTHLIKVVARIVDGRDVQYIAGSGKTPATKRRLEIFYTESGITPREGQPKKKKVLGSILQKAVDEAELDDDDEDIIELIKNQLENEGIFEESINGLDDIFQNAQSLITKKDFIDRIDGSTTLRTEVIEKSSKTGNFSISTASTFVPYPQVPYPQVPYPQVPYPQVPHNNGNFNISTASTFVPHPLVPHPQVPHILSRSVSIKVSEPSNQPINVNFGISDEDHMNLKSGASFDSQSRSRPHELVRDRVITYNIQSLAPSIFENASLGQMTDEIVGSKRTRIPAKEEEQRQNKMMRAPPSIEYAPMQRSASNNSTFSDHMLRTYSNHSDLVLNHFSVGLLDDRMHRSNTGVSVMSDGSGEAIGELLGDLPDTVNSTGGFSYFFDYQI